MADRSLVRVISVSAPALVLLLGLAAPGCSPGGEVAGPGGGKGSVLPVGNTHPGFCQVTGEKLDVAKAGARDDLHSDFEGKRYLFCCKDCKPDFEKDPRKYIDHPPEPEKDGHAGHDH